MTHQDYLTKRGWKQIQIAQNRLWADPLGEIAHPLPIFPATQVQYERDAAHLDTALAALELAERALAYHAAFCFKTDSKEQAEGRDALAAVRAAREGKE